MEKTSAKANFLYNIVYQVLLMITPLITAPYLARVVGSSGVGIFSYTNTIACNFAVFGLLGLNNYGNRIIAQKRDNPDELNRVFSGIFYLQIFISLFVNIAYGIYIFAFVKENIVVSLFQFITVLSVMINFNWAFWGLEKFKITVTRNLIIKFVTLACTFIFVRSIHDLPIYTLIICAGTFFGNAALLRPLFQQIKLVKVPISDVLEHLKPNLILFVPILAMTIDRSLDKIMLGCMSSYSEVGYFESADKIIALSLGCITALGQVMLPKASNLIQNGQAKESSRLLSKSLRFSTLFVSALLFGIIGVANNFVTIFFGKAFLPCTSVLMLLAPNLLVLAWTYTLKAQYLIPRGKDIPFIISTFAGLCVNGILCLLLIPILHAQGAAISTILAECFSAFIIIRYANNEINIKLR